MKDPLTLLPPVVGHAVAIPVGGFDSLRLYLAGGIDHASLCIACSRELGRKPPLYLAVEDPLTLLPLVVGHADAIPVGGLTRFAYTCGATTLFAIPPVVSFSNVEHLVTFVVC